MLLYLFSAIGLLVISAFILTTLDTATRLARYILQELTGVSSGGWRTRVGATLALFLLSFSFLVEVSRTIIKERREA